MVERDLTAVRIVLVEPAGALNVGSVARVMKNMGLSDLHLVAPHCDPLGDEARRMAVHAEDVLVRARVVPALPAALADRDRVLGTSGKPDLARLDLQPPVPALTWAIAATRPAIVFGPEDRGLSHSELTLCQQVMTIPTADTYPSLNLAQAVAIACYQLRDLAIAREAPTPAAPLAAIADLEGAYSHLERVLLRIGYLYPHTAASRMHKLRQLFNRAHLTPEEVAMLRGILRQVEWAIAPRCSELSEKVPEKEG